MTEILTKFKKRCSYNRHIHHTYCVVEADRLSHTYLLMDINHLFYLTGILPAKRDVHRAPLCGCSPVSSSLYHSVYRLCRIKQVHPVIHNTNNFTCGALERERQIFMTRYLIIKLLEIATRETICSKYYMLTDCVQYITFFSHSTHL